MITIQQFKPLVTAQIEQLTQAQIGAATSLLNEWNRNDLDKVCLVASRAYVKNLIDHPTRVFLVDTSSNWINEPLDNKYLLTHLISAITKRKEMQE